MTDAPPDQPRVFAELHAGWAEIVLNRPHRRNAITGPFATDFEAALAEVNSGSDLRSVVLRGAGGAFCSGLDIKEFNAEPPPPWFAEFSERWRRVHVGLFDCPHTLVGALERFAINGGAALALACDYLVVGESAFLQVGEVQQGMAAPYNLAWLRLRHSEAVAANLALTGRRLTGEELLDLGIVQEVTADDRVVDRAREVAETLAAFPAQSGSRIKALSRRYSTPLAADEWFDIATSMSAGAGRKPQRQSS